jgi:hypothetical protein
LVDYTCVIKIYEWKICWVSTNLWAEKTQVEILVAKFFSRKKVFLFSAKKIILKKMHSKIKDILISCQTFLSMYSNRNTTSRQICSSIQIFVGPLCICRRRVQTNKKYCFWFLADKGLTYFFEFKEVSV